MKNNFWFVVILLPVHASLFLTPEEKKKLCHVPETRGQGQSLKLKAIFYRPDLSYWIVWINTARIDSRHPISIEGWTVTQVTMNSVKLRSFQGQEQELFLQPHLETEHVDSEASCR